MVYEERNTFFSEDQLGNSLTWWTRLFEVRVKAGLNKTNLNLQYIVIIMAVVLVLMGLI